MSETTPESSDQRTEIEADLAAERFEAAAAKLIDLAEVAPDDEVRMQAIGQAAGLFAGQLGDAAQAVVLWGILAEFQEEDGRLAEAAQTHERIAEKSEAPGDSLQALIEIYGELEDWQALLRTSQTLLGRCGEDSERLERLEQISMIQEALGEADGGLLTAQQILELQPDHPEAFATVESSMRRDERWAALQTLYEGCAQRAQTDARATWLLKAAEVATQLGGDGAERRRLLEEVLTAQPNDTEAFTELEEHYDGQKDWASLSRLWIQRGETESEDAAKLDFFVKAAKLLEEKANDPSAAIPCYERAMRVKRDHEPAIDGLLRALLATGQYAVAAQVVELKIHLAPEATQEIDLRLSLALLWRDQIGDETTALSHFEKALSVDPHRREALVALGEDYVTRELWVEATPLLERALLTLAPDEDPALRARLNRWVGRCAKELMNHERALEAYQASHKTEPLNPTELISLADLLFEKEEFASAQDLYQDILDKGLDEVEGTRLNEVRMHLGECASHLGQSALALDYVAQVEGDSVDELERMVKVHARSENWAGVITFKKKLLATRSDNTERFQDQMAIGDTYLQGLGDKEQAREAYMGALALGTASRGPLVQLLQLSVDSLAFDEAMGFLERLSELEESAKKKAKWTMSMGALAQDGMKDAERAVGFYEATLAHDPTQLQAFQALVAILHPRGAWKKLENAYIRMIGASTPNATDSNGKKLLYMLHRNLGDIYQEEMTDPLKAIDQFETALSFFPGERATRERVARLCVRTPEQLEKAKLHYRLLISHSPDQIGSYHSLSAIWASSGNLDGSWRIAGLLSLFGKAMDAEQRFFEKFVSPKPVTSHYQLTDDAWRQQLRSYEQDEALTRVFSLIAPTIASSFFPKHAKALGLTKKEALNVQNHPVVAATATQLASLLGTPEPQLYRHGDAPISVLQGNFEGLAFSEAFLQEKDEKAIAFRMGRQMAYLRPEHRLAVHFDSYALQGLYMAAGCAVDSNFAVRVQEELPPEESAQAVHFIQEAALALKQHLGKQAKKEIQKALAEVEPGFGPHTIELWRRGVDLTATFAGLAAVGDVLTVGRIIQTEQTGTSSLTADEKMKATIGFVLSDRYTKLRQAMGVAVGVNHAT